MSLFDAQTSPKTIALCAGWYITTVFAAVATKLFLKAGGDAVVFSLLAFTTGAIPAATLWFRGQLGPWLTAEIAAVACLHCCNNVLTNIGLSGSSIRLVYSIKALEPCFTCFFDSLVNFRAPDLTTASTCIAIAVATFFAIDGDLTITPYALFICLFSTAVASGRTVVFKSGLTEAQKADPLTTFSAINFLSLGYGLLFTVVRPPTKISTSFSYETVLPLVIALVFTLSYNSLSFQVAARVRSVIHSTNNVVKRLLTVVCGLLWFGGSFTFINVAALLAVPALSLSLLFNRTPYDPVSLGTPPVKPAGVDKSTKRVIILVSLFVSLCAAGASNFLASFGSASSFNVNVPSAAIARLHVKQDAGIASSSLSSFEERCHPSEQDYHLYAWRMSTDVGTPQNFGDEIGPGLVERMLGQPVTRSDGAEHRRVLSIGSIVQHVHPCDVVWGSGVRAFTESSPTSNMQVRAMRGPLSRKALLAQYPDLYVPEVYGDPALLLPHFFPEFERKVLPGDKLDSRVIVIPHFRDGGKIPETDWYKIVSPLAVDWKDVVSEIVNATFVISSSLHGLIVADAFGVPSRGLLMNLDEPDFKFNDFYLGTGRPSHRRVATVDEARWMGPEDPLNWDAQPLIDALPRKLLAARSGDVAVEARP
ncbi:hypothetical protein JCM10212_004107 [Sporobolomyces blumeae]